MRRAVALVLVLFLVACGNQTQDAHRWDSARWDQAAWQ
jgi:hypothetical protein